MINEFDSNLDNQLSSLVNGFSLELSDDISSNLKVRALSKVKALRCAPNGYEGTGWQEPSQVGTSSLWVVSKFAGSLAFSRCHS